MYSKALARLLVVEQPCGNNRSCMRRKGKSGAATEAADSRASSRSTDTESDQPSGPERLDLDFREDEDIPFTILGISNLRQLYEVYGRYSDRQFPRRIFEGEAFRQLVERGADQEWLRTLCEEVEALRYQQAFFVRGRRILSDFHRALAKAVKAGAALNSMPGGNAFGEMRHKLLLCLGHMQRCEETLGAFIQQRVRQNSAPNRGAHPDEAADHFRWQVDHYPWVSRPPDRLLVQLYKDLTGRTIDVESFRRARRRDRKADR